MSNRDPKPEHVPWPGVRIAVESVKSLILVEQDLTGVGVHVVQPLPHWGPVHVHRLVERRPPDLRVRGPDHAADDLPRNRASDGYVQGTGPRANVVSTILPGCVKTPQVPDGWLSRPGVCSPRDGLFRRSCLESGFFGGSERYIFVGLRQFR